MHSPPQHGPCRLFYCTAVVLHSTGRCQGMLWGASSATDRQSPLEYNDPHLPRQCSQNSSVMHTPRHSCTHAPKQSFSIHNTLKDDGMPAFSFEVVNMALLWGYNGYVWPIIGSNTLRKAPLLLNVGCHFVLQPTCRTKQSFCSHRKDGICSCIHRWLPASTVRWQLFSLGGHRGESLCPASAALDASCCRGTWMFLLTSWSYPPTVCWWILEQSIPTRYWLGWKTKLLACGCECATAEASKKNK